MGTFRRTLHRMAGLLRLTAPAVLHAVTRLLRMATRSFLLMRRVRVILGLEVLGLVWSTFAIPGHGFSNVEAILPIHIRGLPPHHGGASIPVNLGVKRPLPRGRGGLGVCRFAKRFLYGALRRCAFCDSDEAGHAFQSEAGHLFRREAGRGSDLKPATLGVVFVGSCG